MPRGGQQGQVVQVAGAPAAAGAGTWEGKAGYTGCAGYPHMTRLSKWAGMQEYVGSRRCPTQRVSQVAHAVCILTGTGTCSPPHLHSWWRVLQLNALPSVKAGPFQCFWGLVQNKKLGPMPRFNKS